MSFVQRRGTHVNPGANVLSRRFIQVHVKSITGRWHTISAKTTDTVNLIKSEVRSKEGPGDYRGKGLMFVHDSPEWQNVVHRGEILSDTQSLQRAGVSDGAELHVVRKRRLVPQAKESCGHCLEAPCVHNEAENQYAPDLHWSNAYGWSFPGERDYETHELIDPEFEVQMPSGGLKAQRLRTGPQHNRGDLALVMQPDRDLRESHENELRGSDEGLREAGEHSSLLEEDGASSKVAPMSEDRGLEGQSEEGPDVSDSDSEEHRTHKPRGSRCCRPKKWCRQYCHEVSLGFKQVAAGWWDLIFKPSESEFEPSEGFKDALEKTIDTETCLNLSYQDLGHPYQWQYFVRMVPSFELLKDLNLSNNNLRKLPGFDMPLLQSLNLGYNKFDDLSGVPTLPELITLDLTANNLDTAAGIYSFQKLERLILRDNPVEYKPLYEERVKARAPASLCWLDGKPFEAPGWQLHYVVKLMFQSDVEDVF